MYSISLTRALAKVKSLDKKLNGNDFAYKNVVAVKIGNRVFSPTDNTNYQSAEEFKSNTVGVLDSLRDTILERAKIRQAIAEANIDTTVDIELFGKPMKLSILELIDYKQALNIMVNVYDNYINQFEDVLSAIDNAETKLTSKVDEQVKAVRGSNQSQPKNVVDSIYESLKPLYQGSIVSNYTKEQLIKERDEIMEFRKNIDMLLSEINARTDIVIK
jgi:hypothetical protein